MTAFNWTCPHCNLIQTVTSANYVRNSVELTREASVLGKLLGIFESTVCSNPECKKITLIAYLYKRLSDLDFALKVGDLIKQYKLIPESSSKPQPEFIPKAIREDYYEACKIKDLSPKSSATLARRCLQGMVQHFCGIKKGRLFDQLEALTNLVEEGKAPKGVTPESVEGIDHVRGIGNIGAHMEADVNVIVSIDPDEAQILIELIETLFDEWYVAQHKREEKFKKLKELGAKKKLEKENHGKKS